MKKIQFTAQELEGLISRYSFEVRRLSYELEQTQEQLEKLRKQYEKSARQPRKAVAKKATVKKARKVTAKKVTAKKVTAKKVAVKKPAAKALTRTVKKAGAVAAKTAIKPAAPKKQRGRPRKEKKPMPVTTSATTAASAATSPKRKRGRPKKSETAAKAAPVKKTAKKAVAPKATAKAAESKNKGYRLSNWDNFIMDSIREANRLMVNSELMDLAKAKIKKEKTSMSDMMLHGKLNRSIHKLANKRAMLIKTEYPGKGNAYGLPEWMDEKKQIRPEYKKSGK